MAEKLQGLNAMMTFLGLPATFDRKAFKRWIREEGLPAKFVAGRYYADPDALRAWWDQHDGTSEAA